MIFDRFGGGRRFSEELRRSDDGVKGKERVQRFDAVFVNGYVEDATDEIGIFGEATGKFVARKTVRLQEDLDVFGPNLQQIVDRRKPPTTNKQEKLDRCVVFFL